MPSPAPFLIACASAHAKAVPRLPAADDPDFDMGEAIDTWLDTARETATEGLRDLINELQPARVRRVIPLGDGHVALVARRRASKRYGLLPEDTVGDIASDDDDTASFTGEECTLRRHLDDVESEVRGFVGRLGLGEDVAGDLVLAASLHDVGKADSRFQQMLLGGNEIRLAMLDEPLAKSRGEARDIVARNRARERAGYPTGYRHELLSVAMLEGSPEALDAAADRDLVLHLVASHHGWCRPFAPAVDPGPPLTVNCEVGATTLHADAAHGLARLDSGIADRFFDLTERYGWWGLAWLEAILRLADHRASAAESASAPLASPAEARR